jgi:hypothetical protein
VINRDLRVGQRGAVNPERVRMGFDQHMGPHYPFTLADKLKVITEPCAWYTPEGGAASPWGRAIIPIEMISVLLGSTMEQAGFRGRGPAVGLFAGQEIRLVQGPLFVDQPYELEREIIALSESARTESVWVRTRIRDGQTQALVAEMVLNSATLKASYAATTTRRVNWGAVHDNSRETPLNGPDVPQAPAKAHHGPTLTLPSPWEGEGNTGQATCTSRLPIASPFIMPISAAGAFSMPCTMSSWNTSSPDRSQGATRAW